METKPAIRWAETRSGLAVPSETKPARETETTPRVVSGLRETTRETSVETGAETMPAPVADVPAKAVSPVVQVSAETTETETETKAGSDPVSRPLRWAVNIVVWTLSAIATYVAARGQVAHAKRKGVDDPWLAWMFPASLELTAIAFMLLGYIQARRGKSPWPLWAVAAGFGAWAVHLQVEDGAEVGELFAVASVSALALWFAKLTIDFRQYLADTDRAGLGLLWVVNPRLAWRTTLIKARMRRVHNTSTHIQLAELWIAVFDDSATTNDGQGKAGKVSKKLRRRAAWRTVMVSAGHPIAELPSMASIERVTVIDRPAPTFVPPPVEPAPVPVASEHVATAEELHALVHGPAVPPPARRRRVHPSVLPENRAPRVPVSPAPAGAHKVDLGEASSDPLADIPGLFFIRNPQLRARATKDAQYLRAIADHLGAEVWTRPEPVTYKGDIKRATGISGGESLKRLGQLVADLRTEAATPRVERDVAHALNELAQAPRAEGTK